MATLSVKPTNRYALADWFASNNNISTNSERQRDESHQVRQETRGLVNVTNNKTKWDQHDNLTRFDDRIWDLTQWKIALERTLNEMNKGIQNLDQSKLTTELSLEEKGVWLDVAIECLTLRECRRDIDVVKDYVEDELHKEVEIINKVKEMLQKRINEAFAQLSIMREARQQVVHDLEDKSEAINIDETCYSMKNSSSMVSFKPKPTRVHKDSTTPESWFQFSRYNKERSDAEIKAGIRMQEIIDDTLSMARNELEAQRMATEYGYRKRLHEQERAKGELEWQQFKIKEELAEIEEDIRRLEESIREKQKFLKLAHTRLEDRTYRPNVELCRDNPQYGLTEEVYQLEGTISRLQEKLAQDHHTRHALYRQLYRIEEDIKCKKNSIALDSKCMDLRRKLVVPEQEYVARPPTDESNRIQDRDSTPNFPVKTEFLSASYKTVP